MSDPLMSVERIDEQRTGPAVAGPGALVAMLVALAEADMANRFSARIGVGYLEAEDAHFITVHVDGTTFALTEEDAERGISAIEAQNQKMPDTRPSKVMAPVVDSLRKCLTLIQERKRGSVQ